MLAQPPPPDDLIAQRSRTVRARRGQLEHDRMALYARSAILRARADQATPHARLVRSAASHTLEQTAKAVRWPASGHRPRPRAAQLPVAAFTELVTAFLQEMAAHEHRRAGGGDGAAPAPPQLDRAAALIARGRELRRRPPYLAPLTPASVEECQA